MYQDAYLESEVLSASPVQLVSMLYRGALQSLRDALLALQRGDIVERSRKVGQAESILGELAVSLDRSQGGKLSQDLSELYDYMQRRLAQANFEQTAGPIEEVCGLLSTLLEAWTEIAESPSVAAAAALSGGSSTGSYRGSSAGLAAIGAGRFSWDLGGGSKDGVVDQDSGQLAGVDFERSRVDRLG